MRKKFDQELEAVKENLAKMGLLCEQGIEMAIEYIEKPDQKLETSIAETERKLTTWRGRSRASALSCS